ncbi:hypothetical protein ACFQFQ_26220 [Sulfitobacter porphyrae]|uniref:Uncharacterized protein n=1 Tax=Sulfitobacter porphyrae TaxID=1246864 RepID=A0ABW2BAI8_9RHOB
MSKTVLADLAEALASGQVRVIDLTNTLSPDSPVIVLLTEFGQCAPFRMEKLSRYDADGRLVLEQHFDERTHRHPFRCPRALGDGQGSAIEHG